MGTTASATLNPGCLLGGWGQAGLGAAPGAGPWSRDCPPLTVTRMGEERPGPIELYPRPGFLLEMFLTNQSLILLLAALPASGETKPGQVAPARGLVISAGTQKGGEKISPIHCSLNCREKKIPSLDCLLGRGHIFCMA